MSHWTPEELERMREIMHRREVAYRFMDRERTERIRATKFSDIVHVYDLAFEASKKKPLRPSSGLVEWYRCLMKTLDKK